VASTRTPHCDFGWEAPDFSLAAFGGRMYRRADIRGFRATLVMFIGRHRPCVRPVIDRLERDVGTLQAVGARGAAIMANDYARHADDAPDKMRAFAAEHRFTFPDLADETRAVARACGAVHTSEFFDFGADLGLRYRGRLDESGRPAGAVRGHAPGGGNRPRPRGAAPEHGMFDQMTRVRPAGRRQTTKRFAFRASPGYGGARNRRASDRPAPPWS